ncbi:O-antigen ligase family protein [Micromonospora sp. NPDC047730]|uniref:O-antigen ligase family protein n=1 Tax=Micromonospora sp. NPDC047730 TaxID=3364253 RepID=UPI003713F101
MTEDQRRTFPSPFPHHASQRRENGAGTGRRPNGLFPARELPGLVLICAVAFVAAWSPKLAATYGGAAAVIAILVSCRLPRLHLADVLAGLTAVWALASTMLGTVDPSITWWLAYLYASACLVFIAVRHVVTNRTHLLTVAFAHLAGCAATSVTLILGARSNADHRDALLDYNIRYGVDGININYTSYTFVTGAVLAVVLLRVGLRSHVIRATLVGALLVFVYGVLLTGSKGATLGLILGASFLALTAISSPLAWAVARVCVPVLILLVPFTAASRFSAIAQRLDTLFGRETGDLSGRLEVWPLGVSAWMEQPFTGLGPGVFRMVNPFQIGPHNLLLAVGTDLGLVGVLLYGSAVAAALAAAARQAGHVGRIAAGLFAMSLLPIWMSGHWEYAQGSWLVLALLSSVAIATNRTGRKLGRHRSPTARGQFAAGTARQA